MVSEVRVCGEYCFSPRREAVVFHLENVEFEMKSAIAALPRLKALGRWANQREAPNVFGVAISNRMPSAINTSWGASMGDQHDADGKTKTESIALQFLRSGTSSVGIYLDVR